MIDVNAEAVVSGLRQLKNVSLVNDLAPAPGAAAPSTEAAAAQPALYVVGDTWSPRHGLFAYV